MKNIIRVVALLLTVLFYPVAGANAAVKASPGEQAFVKYCAVCHANGGNIVNSAKTLSKKVLAANGIKSAADIVKNMREPGPLMTRFDKETIDDKTARAIADYILKTFK